jgi:hypothetical protein
VRPTSNEPEDLFLDSRPLRHHLGVARSQHDKALRGQFPVSSAISLEVTGAVMPGATIEFEHEPVSDDQVDGTDPLNRDLGSHSQVQPPQRQPRKGLDPGLTGRIREREESLSPWTRARTFCLGSSDDSEIQCGVECDHGSALIRAAHCHPKRVDRRVHRESMVLPSIGPVHSDAVIDAGCCPASDSNVQQRFGHRPHSVNSQCGNAGESSARGNGSDDGGCGAGQLVPAGSDPEELTRTKGGLDLVPADIA